MKAYKVVFCKPYYYDRQVTGTKELEELLNKGWEIYRADVNHGHTTGGFNIYFLKKEPTSKLSKETKDE